MKHYKIKGLLLLAGLLGLGYLALADDNDLYFHVSTDGFVATELQVFSWENTPEDPDKVGRSTYVNVGDDTHLVYDKRTAATDYTEVFIVGQSGNCQFADGSTKIFPPAPGNTDPNKNKFDITLTATTCLLSSPGKMELNIYAYSDTAVQLYVHDYSAIQEIGIQMIEVAADAQGDLTTRVLVPETIHSQITYGTSVCAYSDGEENIIAPDEGEATSVYVQINENQCELFSKAPVPITGKGLNIYQYADSNATLNVYDYDATGESVGTVQPFSVSQGDDGVLKTLTLDPKAAYSQIVYGALVCAYADNNENIIAPAEGEASTVHVELKNNNCKLFNASPNELTIQFYGKGISGNWQLLLKDFYNNTSKETKIILDPSKEDEYWDTGYIFTHEPAYTPGNGFTEITASDGYHLFIPCTFDDPQLSRKISSATVNLMFDLKGSPSKCLISEPQLKIDTTAFVNNYLTITYTNGESLGPEPDPDHYSNSVKPTVADGIAEVTKDGRADYMTITGSFSGGKSTYCLFNNDLELPIYLTDIILTGVQNDCEVTIPTTP